VFGEGGADQGGVGPRCRVQAGDVVVIPAGVAHASVSSAADDHDDRPEAAAKPPAYRYIGVYPPGAPHWRNEFGKNPLGVDRALFDEVAQVPVPIDPVYGHGGPLVEVWTAALHEAGR
jgi:uncharacterized protein YjlB